jgi:hypothetical protein
MRMYKTSLCAGFSSLEPSLSFFLNGIELPIDHVYWGKFGVNTGVKLESEISNFALRQLQIVLTHQGSKYSYWLIR